MSRKQNVEPGVWLVPPPGQRAIYPAISALCEFKAGRLVVRDYLAWGRSSLPEREVVAAMAELYNTGVRFVADGPLLQGGGS